MKGVAKKRSLTKRRNVPGPTPRKWRGREETKRKILAAVGGIIRKEGFPAVRINNIARQAGVDKVLLYRYFGDLPGLLKEYSLSKDTYRRAPRIRDYASSDMREAVITTAAAIMVGQARTLRTDPEMQELYRWELSESNDITSAVAASREEYGLSIMEDFSRYVDFRTTDIPAISALLNGGLTYLVLRSKSAEYYNGVSLRSDKGWARLEQAVSFLLELLKHHLNSEHAIEG